jgi:hypothetical protein
LPCSIITKAEKAARTATGNDEDYEDEENPGETKPLNVGNTDDHLSSDEEVEVFVNLICLLLILIHSME